MSEILEFEVNGRRVTCIAILVDCVHDLLIPDKNSQNDWDAFHTFIVQRSQNALGKWPVHLIPQSGSLAGSARFTGFRVHAKCCAFRPDEPEIVEYAILVWFQNEINVTLAPPASLCIDWSDFAEAIEI